MKRYLKMLTKEDITKILKAADIDLMPDKINLKGEIINTITKFDDFILCKAQINKNKELNMVVDALSSLVGDLAYNPKDILVSIYEYEVNVFGMGELYDEEAVKMTLKLKEILSAKSKAYANNFKEYWEKQEEDEENDEL